MIVNRDGLTIEVTVALTSDANYKQWVEDLHGAVSSICRCDEGNNSESCDLLAVAVRRANPQATTGGDS